MDTSSTSKQEHGSEHHNTRSRLERYCEPLISETLLLCQLPIVLRETKAKVIKGIIKVFKELSILVHAVEAVVHEVPREKLGSRRRTSERFKEIKPP
jgi:hypothetical protein